MKLYGEIIEIEDALEGGIVAIGIHRGWEFELHGAGYTDGSDNYGDFQLILHIPKDQYPMLHKVIGDSTKAHYLRIGISNIIQQDFVNYAEEGEIQVFDEFNLKNTSKDLLDWVKNVIDRLADYWEKEDN